MAGAAQNEVLGHGHAPGCLFIDGSEVVDVVGLGHEEVADCTGVAESLGFHEVVAAAHGLGDEQGQAGLVHGLDDSLGFFHGVNHGLGDHDVLAGVEGGEYLVGVQRAGGVYAHYVYVGAGGEFGEVGSSVADAVFAGGGFQPIFVGVAEGGHADWYAGAVGSEEGFAVPESG